MNLEKKDDQETAEKKPYNPGTGHISIITLEHQLSLYSKKSIQRLIMKVSGTFYSCFFNTLSQIP